MLLLFGALLMTVCIFAAVRVLAWWRSNEWRRVARRSETPQGNHER